MKSILVVTLLNLLTYLRLQGKLRLTLPVWTPPLTGLSCVHQGEDGKSGTPGRDGKPGKEVCRSAGQYDTWIKNVQSRPSVICSSIRLHYSKSKSKKCAHTKSYALNFNSTGYKEDLPLTSCCLKSVKNKPVDRFGLGWIVSHWQI